MSERDITQSAEELESNPEGEINRELDQATHEPGAQVEQTGNIDQAEDIESAVNELMDPKDRQQSTEVPSKPLMEKELPEGGQLDKELNDQEDLQGVSDGDFSSLMPGKGKLTDPLGNETKGDGGLDDVSGMDSRGKLSDDPTNPSGEEHPGAGIFLPGKGPGAGIEKEEGDHVQIYILNEDELAVKEMIDRGASEKEIAAKEKELQEEAMDDYELAQQVKDPNYPPAPPAKKSSTESSPEGEGGSQRKPVSKQELEAVIEETSGDQISNKDPEDQSGGVPDRLTREGAEQMEKAKDSVKLTKPTRIKAGSEVVTDPDPEQPEAGTLGKKEEL